MLVPALPVTLGKPLLFPAPYSLSLCKGRAARNVCRAPALPLALPLALLAAGSGRWRALAAGWHRRALTHRELATRQGWAMAPSSEPMLVSCRRTRRRSR